MPKIIENVREQLLCAAKEQLRSRGYNRTTIRSVANACGLSVGTVYNYFKSKDMLIATFMAEEWQACLIAMKSHSSSEDKVVLERIYVSLQNFIQRHQYLFSDSDAAKVFAAAFSELHKQLRDQLADIILPICNTAQADDKGFLAEFIAEALLTWTVEGKSFEELSSILILLLQQKI